LPPDGSIAKVQAASCWREDGSYHLTALGGQTSAIDLTTADVTLVAMKRRLLFFILLAIVLALLIKYGANATPLAL
jgi:hypothetical protein